MVHSDLKGKTVFITGASSGFGRACAEKLARAGCRLILCARRVDMLNTVTLDLKQRFHAPIYSGKLDVRDRESVEYWFANLPDEWKKIDILINNAGLALGFEKIQEGNIDDWDTMIDTNVKGLLYVTRLFMQLLPPDKAAHIVNMGLDRRDTGIPERGGLLRDEGGGPFYFRFDQDGSCRPAYTSHEYTARICGNGVQPGPFSWRQKPGQEFLQGN